MTKYSIQLVVVILGLVASTMAEADSVAPNLGSIKMLQSITIKPGASSVVYQLDPAGPTCVLTMKSVEPIGATLPFDLTLDIVQFNNGSNECDSTVDPADPTSCFMNDGSPIPSDEGAIVFSSPSVQSLHCYGGDTQSYVTTGVDNATLQGDISAVMSDLVQFLPPVIQQ